MGMGMHTCCATRRALCFLLAWIGCVVVLPPVLSDECRRLSFRPSARHAARVLRLCSVQHMSHGYIHIRITDASLMCHVS